MKIGSGKTKPIRLVELFAGIGSQAKALEHLGIPHERTAVCEIDKKAYASYVAIHGETPNLGDITKVEKLPECDLLTYSFPCQDLSAAGNRKGMVKGSGTRSSLLWEVGRLLRAGERERLPQVLLMENVDKIVSKKNIRDFNYWISELSDLGYTSSWKVLNAKDFGIPQNRDRCIMVSMLGGKKFEFPEGFPLKTRLRDCLEDNPDKTYYLSDKAVKGLIIHKARRDARGNGFGFKLTDPDIGIASAIKAKGGWRHTDTLLLVGTLEGKHEQTSRVYDASGRSPTLCCMGEHGNSEPKIAEYLPIKCATKKGYMEGRVGDGCHIYPTDRETVQKGMSPTIKTSPDVGVICEGLRVRRLTPLEIWRLMGFDDGDYIKASKVVSKTQLLKQAGDSIVVDTLVAIFKNLYLEESVHIQSSIFAY